MVEFVEYCKDIRWDCLVYGIPCVLFEAINIQYKTDGLCVPGLGAPLYQVCGAALLQVLKKTLPTRHAGTLRSQLYLVRDGNRNRYELLWSFLSPPSPSSIF